MAEITLKRVMVYKGGGNAIKAAENVPTLAGYYIQKRHHADDFSSYIYPLLLETDEIYDSGNNIVTTSVKNPKDGEYTFRSFSAVLNLVADKLDDVRNPADGGKEGADVTVYINLGGVPGKPSGPDERLVTIGDDGKTAAIQIQNGQKNLNYKMGLTKHTNTAPPNSYLLTSHEDLYKLMLIKFDDAQGDIDVIDVSGDSKLTLTFTFTYEGPSINDMGALTIAEVKKKDGKIDDASRKLSFSWIPGGYAEGNKPFKEMKTVAKAKYRLYDTTDNVLLYTNDDVPKSNEQQTTTTITSYAAVYGVSRPYKLLLTLFDSSDNTIDSKSISHSGMIASKPIISTSPATKLVGNTTTEEDIFDQISTGSVLTDESVTLKWTNPVITHAESLRVNYEIMISTDGKKFSHLDYVYQIAEDCPSINKDSTKLNNQPKDTEDQYINKYVIDKTILKANGIKNYQKVYVGVKVLISDKFNDKITYQSGKTRTLTQTKQSITSFNQDMIENFICVFECNVHYCPDGFTWRKCLVYYCPNGEKWVPVVLRWSPTGDHWVYC